MKRFEERITIDAPAGRVFDYFSDFARHGEWAGHGLQVTRTGDGPVAVGTTFDTVAKQFGTQRERSTITEITPGRAFGWDSSGALGRVHHWFGLEDSGGSTTLAKGVELTQPSFLARVMGWRISRETPKALRADLEKIKAHLEASAT
jgi:uncharacterized membrane protein